MKGWFLLLWAMCLQRGMLGLHLVEVVAVVVEIVVVVVAVVVVAVAVFVVEAIVAVIVAE